MTDWLTDWYWLSDWRSEWMNEIEWVNEYMKESAKPVCHRMEPLCCRTHEKNIFPPQSLSDSLTHARTLVWYIAGGTLPVMSCLWRPDFIGVWETKAPTENFGLQWSHILSHYPGQPALAAGFQHQRMRVQSLVCKRITLRNQMKHTAYALRKHCSNWGIQLLEVVAPFSVGIPVSPTRSARLLAHSLIHCLVSVRFNMFQSYVDHAAMCHPNCMQQ